MAIATAQRVGSNFTMFPGLVRQSGELVARAQVEMRRAAKEREQNAERLAQRGDQYYQQAQGYLELYLSNDRNQSLRVINPRWEAVKFYDMAISTWREALRIDRSLGDIASFDLDRKITEAQGKRDSLANTRAPRFSRRPTTERFVPKN
jgi:hypothetical protein